MISEIKDFKLKQLEKELKEYNKVNNRIKHIEEQIVQLEEKIKEENKLIPYKNFNWIQKYITQTKQYKNYKKMNKQSSESIEILRKEIERLRRERIELIIERGKIDGIQLKINFEEIRKIKNIRKIRIKF